jgi:putative SOS response-associated peptidase YedK
MCGRFVRKRSLSESASDFGVEEVTEDLPPSFNVAPTHNVGVVIRNETKQLVSMRWGLVPSWATDPRIGSKLINARAETLRSRSAFKSAFKMSRCLVVADGFYEWRKRGGTKTPLLIHLRSKRTFGFAGLYETWKSPLGESLVSCTIVTTAPNELVSPIHDRMPVILSKEAEEFWLDPDITDHKRLLDILQPYPAEKMSAYEVSNLVNSVKNDSPACIEPAQALEQRRLF